MKEIVRNFVGVPLLILSHSAINLEAPSISSVDHVTQKTENKLKPRQNDLEAIQKLKAKLVESSANAAKPLFKRRKAKGPNPLSCLKSKRLKQKHKN